MHELSVAISVVESVVCVLEEEGGGRVRAVGLAVGAHAGVVTEALAYAWGPATAGTPLAGSRLEVEPVAASVWCGPCDAERELPGQRLRCPVCDAPAAGLLTGRELDLLSFELEEPPAG